MDASLAICQDVIKTKSKRLVPVAEDLVEVGNNRFLRQVNIAQVSLPYSISHCLRWVKCKLHKGLAQSCHVFDLRNEMEAFFILFLPPRVH